MIDTTRGRFGSLADVRGQSAGVKIATVFADGLNAMAEHF